ncbi:S10 family serine carboxypeptidase-like protein, partial [Phyllobacterium sp. P5_D12]
MLFRLCWLVLAVFLASCSGSSEDEDAATSAISTFKIPDFSQAKQEPDIPAIHPEFLSDPDYGPEGKFYENEFNERPTSKINGIYLKGSLIRFAVTAGHLKAESSRNASASSLGKAAIFYTAYTRQDLPKTTRPLTFIFNGGPGGASAVMDVGFLRPMRFDWNAPTFALADNPNTLLDKTDLVFVDPVGTGYSKAIFPNKNDDFWGVDDDASVLADFIIQYINANQRQESPKYLYGVSY